MLGGRDVLAKKNAIQKLSEKKETATRRVEKCSKQGRKIAGFLQYLQYW